jgi:2-dehydropantoate 2-reductase
VIAVRFGRERTYLALGSVAADVLGPGEIRFGSSVTMPIGQIDGREGGMLDEIVATMQDFEPRTFGAPDIQDYMWGKHCFNTLTSATAAGLSPMAVLIGRDDLRPIWRGLYQEVLAIAFAQGIKPRQFALYDPMAFAPGAPPEAEEAFIHTLVTGPTNKSKPHSGMWRDLAIHHRQTEVAALLEPIARVGDQRGLKTSLLHGVVAMIREIEQGKRAQDDANLVELLDRAG